MWKTFSLTSLVVSIILVCPVTQSHGFDLEEWIPSFDWVPSAESIKEALTSEAECTEVFDDGSESSSITCTPKNDRQRLEQTQQRIQKTQQRVQQPASQQTRQQTRPSLPNTLINCKEQKHIWNGKINHELKKLTHRYLIDHDEKRLRSIGENRPWRKWRKVLEFSDHLIRVKRVNKKKVRVDTLTIDRMTGRFDERRVISNEQALKSLGKPGVLKVSGSCEKIEATPKF